MVQGSSSSKEVFDRGRDYSYLRRMCVGVQHGVVGTVLGMKITLIH